MNIRANQMQGRICLMHKDIRHLSEMDIGQPADWVICNPPYHRASSGRINPSDQKAVARHEVGLDLPQLIQASKRLLKTRGRLATIFPADRTADLLCAMRSSGIEPKWLQSIHSHAGKSARLVLVQGIKAGRPGMKLVEPLIIYQANGAYTPEVQCMFAI